MNDRLRHRRAAKERVLIGLIVCAAVALIAVVVKPIVRPFAPTGSHSTDLVRYLGVYEPDAPGSYAGMDQFAQAIGRQPNIALYYNVWLKPFQVGFAAWAAKHGAVTLVQIDARHFAGDSLGGATTAIGDPMPMKSRHSAAG